MVYRDGGQRPDDHDGQAKRDQASPGPTSRLLRPGPDCVLGFGGGPGLDTRLGLGSASTLPVGAIGRGAGFDRPSFLADRGFRHEQVPGQLGRSVLGRALLFVGVCGEGPLPRAGLSGDWCSRSGATRRAWPGRGELPVTGTIVPMQARIDQRWTWPGGALAGRTRAGVAVPGRRPAGLAPDRARWQEE